MLRILVQTRDFTMGGPTHLPNRQPFCMYAYQAFQGKIEQTRTCSDGGLKLAFFSDFLDVSSLALRTKRIFDPQMSKSEFLRGVASRPISEILDKNAFQALYGTGTKHGWVQAVEGGAANAPQQLLALFDALVDNGKKPKMFCELEKFEFFFRLLLSRSSSS